MRMMAKVDYGEKQEEVDGFGIIIFLLFVGLVLTMPVHTYIEGQKDIAKIEAGACDD